MHSILYHFPVSGDNLEAYVDCGVAVNQEEVKASAPIKDHINPKQTQVKSLEVSISFPRAHLTTKHSSTKSYMIAK